MIKRLLVLMLSLVLISTFVVGCSKVLVQVKVVLDNQ